MPTVDLVVAKSTGRTGKLLAAALRERNCKLSTPAACRVSYGVPLVKGGLPTLNENAGRQNKLSQMILMDKAGILIPKTFTTATVKEAKEVDYPLFARTNSHKSGKDIKTVFQSKEIPWRIASGSDFFVSFIPWNREFRIWIYRRKHLGSYEKKMVHPDQYKFIGGNHRNGFAFQLLSSESVPRAAVDMSAAAVDALSLDFGAVDILEGIDGKFRVLEVNTAPGADSVDRQAFRGLCDKIATWVAKPEARRG